jgi:hypothetical protein
VRSVLRFGAAFVLLVAFGLAYLPDVGHGFIIDDFAWIDHGRLDGERTLAQVLFDQVGFYRPVVALSFGINHAMFATWSKGYGLTNFLLALGCAAGVWALARAAALPRGPALVAAALWAFNFHGINMAVLWLSGRTSLLLTMFALGAGIAAVKRRPVWIFICSLLALGSKEEAVVLPLICGVWAADSLTAGAWTERGRRLAIGIRRAWPTIPALGTYLIARQGTGAYTAATAPPYYQFTFSPAAVAENAIQYADRSMTIFAAAIVLWAMALGVRPSFHGGDRDVLIKGLAWFVAGFCITLWLPVRSSLYAVFPSVGIALIAAAILGAMNDQASPVRLRRASIGALVLPFVLLPIYWSRNVRWVEPADLTTQTVRAIDAEASAIPERTVIELDDDRSRRANFNAAFGSLTDEASRLHFEERYRLRIVPSRGGSTAGDHANPPGVVGARFALRDGRVLRVE